MTQLTKQTGSPLLRTEAHALAASQNVRERVLAYITRGADELLVFEQTSEYPNAGVQVPAGGLEAGETLEQAALRETREETGLHLREPMYLASWRWRRGDAEQVWHYFWIPAPRETPDAWEHRVTDGENDAGLTFLCRFTPLLHPDLIPGHGYEAALPELQVHLRLEETAHD